MNPKDYIRTKLDEISVLLPELKFKHQFNESTLTHIIQVDPFDDYQSNNNYIKLEAELVFEFENTFFPETILFVSDNSLIQVTNPDFVIQKQTFISPTLKASYSFILNDQIENLFCVKSDCDYALAA